MTEIFYGDETDLREEIGREEREDVAKSICQSDCHLRFACLQYALVNNEKQGVWGGMTSGERREFKSYLRKQGYREIPTAHELRANVVVYEGNVDGVGPISQRDRLSRRYQAKREMEEDSDLSDNELAQEG